jgi:hypothetical protein
MSVSLQTVATELAKYILDLLGGHIGQGKH